MENSTRNEATGKRLFPFALRLSTIAATIAICIPAEAATIWRNYKPSHWTNEPVYLQPVSQTIYNNDYIVVDSSGPGGGGFNFNFWTSSPDPAGSGYWRFTPYNPLGPVLVAGCPPKSPLTQAANNVILTSPSNALDQFWLPGPVIYDNNGALCYVFFNRANPSKVLGVTGQTDADVHARMTVSLEPYYADVTGVAGDQAWCAYTGDANGTFIPQYPPPF